MTLTTKPQSRARAGALWRACAGIFIIGTLITLPYRGAASSDRVCSAGGLCSLGNAEFDGMDSDSPSAAPVPLGANVDGIPREATRDCRDRSVTGTQCFAMHTRVVLAEVVGHEKDCSQARRMRTFRRARRMLSQPGMDDYKLCAQL
jgi:hypothetical protein